MVGGFLDNPGATSEMQRFGVVLQYAAPQLLKLLQISARQPGLGKNIQGILKNLESSVLPSPWEEVKKILEKEKVTLHTAGIEVLSVEPTPIAAGTVAQIHFGRIRYRDPMGQWQEEDTAFRFIKPGLQNRAHEGEKIFYRVALKVDADPQLKKVDFPPLAPVVEGLSDNIDNDLDVYGSGERQKTAESLYKFRNEIRLESGKKVVLDFYVPKVYYYTKGGSLMIQEKVKGMGVDDLKDHDLEVAQATVKAMGIKWVDEAFFLSGFFHADLHPGNFMVQKKAKVALKFMRLFSRGKADHYQVNIIDFGMGGIADRFFRRYFFGMIVAANLGEIDLLTEMIWEASEQSKNKISKDELRKILNEKVKEQLKLPEDQRLSPSRYPQWAIEQGIYFPSILVGLSRGSGVQQLLTASVKDQKEFNQIVKDLLKKKPQRITKLIKPNGLLPNAVKVQLLKKVGSKVVGSSKKALRTCMHYLTLGKVPGTF